MQVILEIGEYRQEKLQWFWAMIHKRCWGLGYFYRASEKAMVLSELNTSPHQRQNLGDSPLMQQATMVRSVLGPVCRH